MKNTKSKKKNKGVVIAFSLLLLLLVIKALDIFGSSDSQAKYPAYEKLDLEQYLDMEKVYHGILSENAKYFLYLQTGIADAGMEELRKESANKDAFIQNLKRYQKQLFSGTKDVQVVPLKEGDILVSMSQRFCYYPHGHAAIVLDGDNGTILEAKSFQAGSCFESIKKWKKMNSFVVLRVREDAFKEQEKFPGKMAAEYAKENLVGLKYSLIREVRSISDKPLQYTQCAHLVWYAYFVNGLDIDENRGMVVKPKDFLKSQVLQVVQVYGMDPKEILELRNE